MNAFSALYFPHATTKLPLPTRNLPTRKIDEQLGKNKFVDVREFQGRLLVDIREYYEKDGEMRPTKKGISLTAAQWEVRKKQERWGLGHGKTAAGSDVERCEK